MPSTPRKRLVSARATRAVHLLALAPLLLAALLGAAAAQVASQDKSTPTHFMSITVGDELVPYIYRIEPITASPGVQRHDVVCSPRRADQRPGVICDIRFDQPTKVTGYTVGESTDPGNCTAPRDCWTASLAPISANGAEVPDDSAFLFMLDRGGRDTGTVRREDRDLVDILANAGPKQQVAVAGFSRSLKIISAFGANRGSMSSDLARIRSDGGVTELYKSAIDGVQALAGRQARRKFLVILSDGTANDSAYDETGLVKAARDGNVQVIAIGYAPDPRDTSQLQTLRKIADDTNGAYLEVRGASQLPAADRKSFMSRFSSGYLLTADSPSSSLPKRVNVILRFDQDRTSLIPIDTETTPALNGPLPQGGFKPALPTPSLVDRLKKNWALLAGIVVALIAIAAAFVLRSRNARARHEVVAATPVVTPQAHYTPPPPPPAPAPKPAPTPVFDERPYESPASFDRDRDDGVKTVVQNETNGFASATVPFVKVPDTPSKSLPFVEVEEQGKQSRVPISKNLARIGRNPENDIVLAGDHVSREHAEISSDGNGGWEIKNRTWRRPAAEGGANPIEVNGHKIDAETHPIHDGDVIRLGNIGNTHLTFRQNAQRSR